MESYQYYLLKSLTRWQPPIIHQRAHSQHAGTLHCLADLKKTIGSYEVFSFDIFDTLLRRNVEPPDYPKRHSLSLVQLWLNRLGHKVTLEDLLGWRKEAEAMARSKSLEKGKDAECFLEEILHEFYPLLATNLEVQLELYLPLNRLADYEFQGECQHLSAMPDAKELLAAIKVAGANIVLVSDMYLSAKRLRHLLDKNQLWQYVNHLAVSCEYGLSKASGRLFERLIDDGVLVPHKTLHIGDNCVADFQQPIQYGLDTHQLYAADEYERRYHQHKHLQLANLFGDYKNWQQNLFQTVDKPLTSAHEIGFYRLGPVFALFAFKVARQALTGQYNRVLFFARDGFLLRNLYKIILERWRPAQQFPHSDIDYVYLSRASTRFADPTFDPHELLSLAQRVNRKDGLWALLSTLGLDKDQYTALISDILGPVDPFDLDKTTVLMTKLLKNELFLATIRNALKQKAVLLHQYLDDHSLTDSTEKQLWVDIGWNGSILKSLESIIRTECMPQVDALFLGRLYGSHMEHINLLPGVIFDQRRNNPLEHLINECRELFEICSSSAEGSVLGYRAENGRVQPMLAETSEDQQHDALVTQLQEGIATWVEHFTNLVNHINPNLQALRPAALTEIAKLLTGYHPEELKLLEGLQFDLSWGTQGRVSLSEYLGISTDKRKPYFHPPVQKEQLQLHMSSQQKAAGQPQIIFEKFHQLIESLKTEPELAIYGVGTVASLVAPHIKDNLVFFVDGNTGLHGKTLMDKPIQAPDTVLTQPQLTVFVSPIGRKTVISKRLTGFSGKVIYIDDYLSE